MEAGLLAVSAGCSRERAEPATASNVQIVLPPENDEEADPETAGEGQADPVALCHAIQRDSEVPIACTFEYLNGTPNMILGVPSPEVLKANLDSMLDHLVAPFCSTLNDAGQPGGVVFTIGRSYAQRLDCRTRTLSEPVRIDPEVARSVTIGEACRAVSRSGYGVGCSMMELRGIPSLILSYRTEDGSEDLVPTIAEKIGGPFCRATGEARMRGAVVLLRDESDARIYDCSTGQLGDWFSVRKVRKRVSRPARGVRNDARAVTAGWKLVPE